MSGLDRYVFKELLAVEGREGCTDPRCRRMFYPDGSIGPCMGYHCPRCGEPCSMMGHQKCRSVSPDHNEAA